MKTLLGVITCKGKTWVERRQAQEETWVPQALKAGLDVQYFDGDRVGVPDDYRHLSQKVWSVFQYALDNGYDRLLKLDDDSHIKVSQFKEVEADYAGCYMRANPYGNWSINVPDKQPGTYPWDYCSGGCYWLSRKSLELVVAEGPGDDWAEDRRVGNILGPHGIEPRTLPDYQIYGFWNIPFYAETRTTILSQIPTPDMMREYHALANSVK